MTRINVFADESGNFDFSRGRSASKYFILTTITVPDFALGAGLLALRRDLAWRGVHLNAEFHAAEDPQAVRDEVFATLSRYDFRVDATILQKSKAQPSIRSSEERFYQMAWYLHMQHVAPLICASGDELLVVGASLGTKRRRAIFHSAIERVIRQVTPTSAFRVASWSGASDPCLQAADYCAWAIQRKWESGDDRSHRLLSGRIKTEFDVFRGGTIEYY